MANTRIPKDYTKKTYKSVHNRSTIRRTTMHPGLMIPIYSRRVMAGEKVFIDPTTVLQTNAMLSPLMGSFTLQLAVFFDSDSNYYSWMDNNTRLSTEELLGRKRHQLDLYTLSGQRAFDIELSYDDWKNALVDNVNYGVRKHSILEYAGLPVKAIPVIDNTGSEPVILDNPLIDLGFILTYLNIFRNYYCNNQEDYFPYVTNVESIYGDNFAYEKLEILDKFFKELRFFDNGVNLDEIDFRSRGFVGIDWFMSSYVSTLSTPFGGLLPCTYRPDLLVNLLNAMQSAQSYVTVTEGKFSIDSLRFQNKLQRLIDRYDISGGRFSNWLRAVWGVKTRRDMDIPELIGVTQKLIDPTDLTTKSNSDEIQLNQDETIDARFTGDLSGNFNKINGHRGHSFFASTSGRVMVIVTLVPNVDYVQGVDYELTKVNFADDYAPEFAQLGFQKVPLSRYSGLPGFNNNSYTPTAMYNTSVGREVAWLPEMTDVNRNFGEFSWCGNYAYWVLNRLYQKQHGDTLEETEFQPSISQYVNPLDYQYPFIAQTIKDPNWFLQVGLKIKTVRPIGKRFMPNLE